MSFGLNKIFLNGLDGNACYWRDLRDEPQFFNKRYFGGDTVMGQRNEAQLIFQQNNTAIHIARSKKPKKA
ncbi:hypothetical protein Y032_0044g950 [Ancylostoma ceylanicum]|uniref:Uncharacterized protein n=1 Tax=Ancylostoma ceylanicum TaxID=53326 RepID=A0A016UES9_9BILA|nr:hypothetical protein Y032_0044g950 [Ancylostoma ceylanicum]